MKKETGGIIRDGRPRNNRGRLLGRGHSETGQGVGHIPFSDDRTARRS